MKKYKILIIVIVVILICGFSLYFITKNNNKKVEPNIETKTTEKIADIKVDTKSIEKEKEEGINGMYKVSHELPELIIHFRKTKTILTNYKKEGSLNDLAKQYLTCNYVSDVMKNIILLNMD